MEPKNDKMGTPRAGAFRRSRLTLDQYIEAIKEWYPYLEAIREDPPQGVKEMSEESEFDCGEDVLEEEDLCDYNGDPCIGDRMFCEECPIWEDLEKQKNQTP